MTIAVISDIHGNISALEAVFADIERRGITDIINLGDSFSGPFDAAATADRLIGLNLPTVMGNHDRSLIDRPINKMGNWERWAIASLRGDHLDWIRALPKTLTIGDIFLCHGTPDRDDENWLDHRGPSQRLEARDLKDVEVRAGTLRFPLMLCGHTHQPRLVRLPGGATIVNPGSVGCPAYLDVRVEPHFVHQTGAPDARYAIVEKRDDIWCAEMISVPYDPTLMIQLALSKGADNWAQAIRNGWFI